MDAQTGDIVVSASVELNRPDRNKMVIAADIFVKSVKSLLDSKSILGLKSGQFILVDSKTGFIIHSQDEKLVGYEIKENDENKLMASVRELFEKENKKVYTKNVEGEKYLFTKNKIDGINWELYTCVKRSEAYSKLYESIVVLILLSLVCMSVVVIVISRVMVGVIKPIKHITSDLTKISDGDLTVEILKQGKTYEIYKMNCALASYLEVMGN